MKNVIRIRVERSAKLLFMTSDLLENLGEELKKQLDEIRAFRDPGDYEVTFDLHAKVEKVR
jgi:hypothetical protein